MKQVPIKEKTAREKALDFAKNNIPKPKQRREPAPEELEHNGPNQAIQQQRQMQQNYQQEQEQYAP